MEKGWLKSFGIAPPPCCNLSNDYPVPLKDKVIRTMRRHGIYTDLRLDFKDKKVEYWKKRGRIPVKKGSGKGSK